jgi:hypothetical protein
LESFGQVAGRNRGSVLIGLLPPRLLSLAGEVFGGTAEGFGAPLEMVGCLLVLARGLLRLALATTFRGGLRLFTALAGRVLRFVHVARAFGLWHLGDRFRQFTGGFGLHLLERLPGFAGLPFRKCFQSLRHLLLALGQGLDLRRALGLTLLRLTLLRLTLLRLTLLRLTLLRLTLLGLALLRLALLGLALLGLALLGLALLGLALLGFTLLRTALFGRRNGFL